MLTVSIEYGANRWGDLEFENGTSVDDILTECPHFRIPSDAECVARINSTDSGSVVDSDYKVRDGQTLEFRKATGRKG